MTLALALPVVCSRTKPPPATAAADFIGVDDTSTHRWLCKGQSRHPMLPATEWIGSHLAFACGLPVPPVALVQVTGLQGTFFGSQWQGGAIDFFAARGRVTNPSLFARTHAIDLFVHNVDRHVNNYLYLDLAGDIVARVIDFSHSWLVVGWPLPALPMMRCNTTACLPHLLAEDPSPYVRPEVILDTIAALPDEWMRETLADMPTAWLGSAERLALRQWWISAARQLRLGSARAALP